MAACLGVMVARLSGVAGVNFLGSFLMTDCTMTFYAFSAYLLGKPTFLLRTFTPTELFWSSLDGIYFLSIVTGGIIVAAYFLPPDKTKNV